MPAKMIIESVASTFSVIGSSMATAVAGPMPHPLPTGMAQPPLRDNLDWRNC